MTDNQKQWGEDYTETDAKNTSVKYCIDMRGESFLTQTGSAIHICPLCEALFSFATIKSFMSSQFLKKYSEDIEECERTMQIAHAMLHNSDNAEDMQRGFVVVSKFKAIKKAIDSISSE